MKNKKVTKHISFMLVVAMLVQTIVVPGVFKGNMTVEAADASEKVTYEESFDGNVADKFLASNLWDLETDQYKGTEPDVVDGIMKMDYHDSVQFNWMKVPNVGAYDSTKTYIFEFDAKVTLTDSYSTDQWKTRVLYVAPGGYHNQVELKDYLGNVRQGDSVNIRYREELYLNKDIHVQLAWTGNSITSTITDVASGSTLINGTRVGKNNWYDYSICPTDYKKYMENLAIRCEDGEIEIDNFVFKVDGATLYTETFDYDPVDSLIAGAWRTSDAKSGIQWTKPEIKNGVMKMDSEDSLTFFWDWVPNVGEYNKKMTYSWEFDAKITAEGSDPYAEVSGKAAYTRILWAGQYGEDTQLGIKSRYNEVQVGSSYPAYNSATYLNQPIHIRIEWLGTTVTTTITKPDGTLIATGSNTGDKFDGVTNAKRLRSMVIRCEDGAVELDNFKFTKELVYETEEQSISIPNGQQAVFEADVAYSTGTITKIDMGGKTSTGADASGELFRISDEGMLIGGFNTAGSFGEGTYKVKAYLNPKQQTGQVEVTLPNGGVIRRGSYQLLYNCTSVTKITTSWKSNTKTVSGAKVTYEDINSNAYELNKTEPVYEGFEANVYNLVTSFDVDAKTTRTFAWTALESYIGDKTMAVQYRVKGANEWQTVDAVKEIEDVEYETEDYFKADVKNLTAGTTYEYRIGKKDSADETNDWGNIYTFTTEAESVDKFSFVAIGDTQGSNWNGTTSGAYTRGFMYTQAALDQAIAEVGDPAFILHTGDVVEHGTNQEHWNLYFKALGDYGKTIPHFAAVGNHDVWADSDNIKPGSADNFDLHFNHPNEGGSAAFATEVIEQVDAFNHPASSSLVRNLDETTYSFNYGNVHFVVLNTGAYDTAVGKIDKIIIEAQTDWLIQDLEANKDAEWTILMMHEPLYHRLEKYNRLEGIHKVIEQYEVDLAILGHSHLVTRTYPMKDGQIVSKEVTDKIEAGTGTVYTTIGATTPSHDGLGDGILEYMYNVFSPQQHQPTYTTVSVDSGAIKLTIKQIDGLVVDEFVIFKEAQEFSGATLELGGEIGVNFYIPKNHGFSDKAYVEFELENGEKQTVSIKDTEETNYGIKFTCWVPAKEMADIITATIYDGGEVKDTASTSVRQYAETIIRGADNNPQYAKAKPLAEAMLNYGSYAQVLFDYKTNNLANRNDIVVDEVANVQVSDLAAFAKEEQGIKGFGTLAGATLILKGETTLKMFFEFKEGASLDGLKFIMDGVEQKYTRSGNYYVVEIADIPAHLLDEDYTVTVVAGNQTFDAVTSAMTYCYNALKNMDDVDLHNAAKALYLYNKAADAYRSGSN